VSSKKLLLKVNIQENMYYVILGFPINNFSKGIESLPQTLIFFFYIFAIQCRRPLLFQTINSARAYNLSLQYLRFKPLGSIDIGIGKFEFVAKTPFL